MPVLFAEHARPKANVGVTDRGSESNHMQAGVIGESTLRRFNMTDDYGHRQVWIDPDDKVPTQPFSRTGRRLRRDTPHSFVVTFVIPSCAACVWPRCCLRVDSGLAPVASRCRERPQNTAVPGAAYMYWLSFAAARCTVDSCGARSLRRGETSRCSRHAAQESDRVNLSLIDAFGSFGAKPGNRQRALSAIAADGALVLNCEQTHFQHPERGVLRYEDRLSRESVDAKDAELLRQHLTLARDGELPVRMVVTFLAQQKTRARRYHVRPDLVGRVVTFDGDLFTVDFERREKADEVRDSDERGFSAARSRR